MQFALNSKWQITAWDTALATASNFTREEVLGRNFVEELVVQEDHDAVLKIFNQVHDDRTDVHDFSFTLYSKSASPIELLLDVFPYFDEAKVVAGVSISASLASQSHQGDKGDKMHFALNSKCQITAWNGALETASRFERYDVLGRNFGDFIVLEDQDDFEEVFDLASQDHKDVKEFEFVLYSKSGMPIKLLLNLCPYFNEGSKEDSMVGVSIFAVPVLQNEKVSNQKHVVEKASQLLHAHVFPTKKIEFSPSNASTTATTLDELPVLPAC